MANKKGNSPHSQLFLDLIKAKENCTIKPYLINNYIQSELKTNKMQSPAITTSSVSSIAVSDDESEKIVAIKQQRVIDPEKQYLYVLVNNVPHIIRPTLQSYEYNAEYHVDKKNHDFLKLYYNKCSSCHGNTRNGGDFTKLQPYARSLVGITLDKDLNKKFKLYNNLARQNF